MRRRRVELMADAAFWERLEGLAAENDRELQRVLRQSEHVRESMLEAADALKAGMDPLQADVRLICEAFRVGKPVTMTVAHRNAYDRLRVWCGLDRPHGADRPIDISGWPT